MYNCVFICFGISVIDNRKCSYLCQKVRCSDSAFSGTEYKYLFSL